MSNTKDKDTETRKQGEQELGKWKERLLKILTFESDTEDTEDLSLQKVVKSLNGEWLIKQVPLLLIIVGFFVVMTTSRYQWQQKQIEKDELKKEIEDVTYRWADVISELTAATLQSEIESRLRSNGDSTLLPSAETQFVININQSEE